MIGGPMACALQTPESKLSLTERHENHGRVLSRRVSDLTSSSRSSQVAGCHQTERGDKVGSRATNREAVAVIQARTGAGLGWAVIAELGCTGKVEPVKSADKLQVGYEKKRSPSGMTPVFLA